MFSSNTVSAYGSGVPDPFRRHRRGLPAPPQPNGNRGGLIPNAPKALPAPVGPDGRTLALSRGGASTVFPTSFGIPWNYEPPVEAPTYARGKRGSYVGVLPYDRTTWIGANDPDHFTYRPKRWTNDHEVYFTGPPPFDRRLANGNPAFKQGRAGYW